jgi:hypothetical protein
LLAAKVTRLPDDIDYLLDPVDARRDALARDPRVERRG